VNYTPWRFPTNSVQKSPPLAPKSNLEFQKFFNYINSSKRKFSFFHEKSLSPVDFTLFLFVSSTSTSEHS
jgi:hypothetical protein